MPFVQIPDYLLCPIGLELMEDPVATEDGKIYERKHIEQWLQTHKTSPMTNMKLSSKKLIPISAIKEVIQDFKSSILTQEQFLKLLSKKELKKIQESRFYASYFDSAALEAAMKTCDVEIVKWILDNSKLDIDALEDFSPLHTASKFGCMDIIQLLIDKGANVNNCIQTEDGMRTALDYAGNLEVAKLLVKRGANPKLMNPHYSFIFTAAKEINMLKWAHQELRMDIKFVDVCGNTALHRALLHAECSVECLEYLIQAGVDINAVNKSKRTALHIAIRRRMTNQSVIKFLLDKGASTSIADTDGKTPLHYSVKCIETAKTLIMHGANIWARDATGLNPFDYASPEVQKELLQFHKSLVMEVVQLRAKNQELEQQINELKRGTMVLDLNQAVEEYPLVKRPRAAERDSRQE